tara:strand:+ start:2787 stop:3269 length:483 start_codon:yes stop_codon:yes gene_type:complete
MSKLQVVFLARLVLVLCIFLASCSPIYRHSRLVKKYPFVHTNDTIIQRDTIRLEVPSVSVDTIFKTENFIEKLNDTIYIEKERLKIKMFKVRDSIFVEGRCDTIYIDKVIIREIPVKYYVEKSDKKNFWYYLKNVGIIILILIIVHYVIQLLKIFRNNER